MGSVLMNASGHGQTPGAAVTPANGSVLGTTPSAVTLAGGGTVTYDGTDRVLFTDPTGASGVARIDYSGHLSGGKFSINVHLPYCATPDAEDRYVTLRNAAGDADVARIAIQPAGTDARKVRVFNGAGTSLLTTMALPSAAGVRFHIGGDLAAGTVRSSVFTDADGYGTTPAETQGPLSVSWNGQTAIGDLRIGSITSAAAVSQPWWNALVVDTTDVAQDPLAGVLDVAGSTALAAVDLAGHVTGGVGPYEVTSAVQIAGTDVGAVHVAGLIVGVAPPTVDAATVRITVEDSAAASDTIDVVFPVGGGSTAGGGLRVWDGAAWT